MIMYSQTLKNGGGTWQLTAGNITPANLPKIGYVVGGIVPTVIIPSQLHNEDALNAAVAYLATIVNDALIGTWQDEHGNIHVDISEFYAAEPQALNIARERGELAIYAIHTGRSINV